MTRKDIIDQLLPGWTYHPEPDQQGYFDSYQNAVDQLSNPGPAQHGYSPVLLTVSLRIYDGEIARRESINTRCSTLLSISGILGTLVVAGGQLGLSQQKGSFGAAVWIELTLFILSLLYIGASIVIALEVQGARQGNVIDPTDLPPNATDAMKESAYNVHMAKVHLNYTIRNYVSNNSLKFRLESGQRYLRNGIILIIVAGMFSPLVFK